MSDRLLRAANHAMLSLGALVHVFDEKGVALVMVWSALVAMNTLLALVNVGFTVEKPRRNCCCCWSNDRSR